MMEMNEQVASLHRQAMEHADAAMYFQSHGDEARFLAETQLALDLEERAAGMLPCAESSEPTRTVLLRSAATLALRCKQFRRAERLVAQALLGFGPEALLEEVRDVLEQVHFDRHLAVRGDQLSDNELQVSLSGQGVSFGVMAVSQCLDRAKNIGNLVRRTTERLSGLPFQQRRGRGKEYPGLYMAAPRAGSFTLTYRLGVQPSLQGLRGPDEILPTLLEDIRVVDNGDWSELRKRIDDDAYMNNFVGLLRQIAPDGPNVRLVGFTAHQKGIAYQVPFRRSRRELLVDQSAGSASALDIVEGILSGADRQTNMVKVDDTRIKVPGGFIDDIVRPLWGQSVRATVERQPGAKAPVLIDVESLDT
ncbi:hypothetical protein [Paraburkholderia terrae]|uniref:hypothetical protein n=1 Tax=Paraburkholderia terrae TaxID=311230 RepID=UPI0033658643